MQHQCIAPGEARRLRLGLLGKEPFAAGLSPPRLPRAVGGLSGRPTCRIYARRDVWILEVDCASGSWLSGRGKAGRSLVFPKLAAAIGYAERHGLDYRIEPPRQPFEVNDEKVDASYDKGVLTIRVPKPADMQRQARRIEVRTV